MALAETLRRMHSDPATAVSLELLDDVAWESDGAPDELLQVKHHLNQAASLSNASGDLWRTLRVWVARSDNGRDNAALTLMTTATAPTGSAAAKLRRDGHRDEPGALATLEKTARTSTDTSTQSARNEFLALTSEARAQLVERITVLDQAAPINDLDERFDEELRFAAHARFRPSLIERLRGWWSGRVMRHLLDVAVGNPGAVISAEEIANAIADLQDQLRDDNLPIDFLESPEPTDDDVDSDHRVFVEQLRLLMIADRRLRLAVRSHHRAFEQRSKWMREELLEYGELARFEATLIEQWELASAREWNLSAGSSEQDRVEAGVRVLDFAETQITTNIRPRCTASYVTVGSLHMLADERRIGWHPDWIERLHAVLGDVEMPHGDDAAAA